MMNWRQERFARPLNAVPIRHQTAWDATMPNRGNSPHCQGTYDKPRRPTNRS